MVASREVVAAVYSRGHSMLGNVHTKLNNSNVVGSILKKASQKMAFVQLEL